MVNRRYANEWIEKARHDLEGAKILYQAGHYSDTVAYILHQSLEKMIKALLAYKNEPIKKTHNLLELYELNNEYLDLNDDELFLLSIATTYQTKQRYPVVQKELPSREEIKNILDLSETLLLDIQKITHANLDDN